MTSRRLLKLALNTAMESQVDVSCGNSSDSCVGKKIRIRKIRIRVILRFYLLTVLPNFIQIFCVGFNFAATG